MEGLDDALAVVTTSDANVIGAGGDDTVMARIEAKLGGESVETQDSEETEETSEEASEETAEEEETQDEEESEEDEDSDEESEEDESEEDSDSDEEIELTEDQLALSLGVKPGNVRLDDDGNVMIKTKVDGKIEYASLNELRDSYVRESNFTQKAQTLSAEKTQFEGIRGQHSQHMANQVGEATALVQALEQQLMGDVNSLNLDQLKLSDPGKWAAVQQELRDRQQFIVNTKTHLQNTIAQGQQENQKKNTESRQQLIFDEADKLLTAYPTWQDPEVATPEIEAAKKAMVETYGIPVGVVESMPYAGFVMMARDAMKVSALKDDTTTLKKKLKSVPKIVKPGKRSKTRGTRDEQGRANRQSKLKKTGSTQDAASVIMDRI